MDEVFVVPDQPQETDIHVHPEAKEHILIVEEGPKGDTGPRGPQGPGGAPNRHVHYQNALANVWTVEHNLNCHPEVSVEDQMGTVFFGTVSHLNENALTVTFANAITGRVNCV